ncbi:coiled-coil domain-containing protein 186 isoform X2 [Hyposmocoma kahamanoa]|uniref:coiled-coil domain-containing protein 186 isoform X2 n=1 Tax=Hyposmocoma kahamanoa TaxID=1477025 RepID=UPI000E6D943D|nr:coiled-coil domain-containing protein 186 isoform X2 [Hyposmocoma kahamanoa]
MNYTDHALIEDEELNIEELIKEAGIVCAENALKGSVTDSTDDLQAGDHSESHESPKMMNENQSGFSNLTTSTVSLDEQKSPLVSNIKTISKSLYSKSAENISTIDQNVDSNLNSSHKELNMETILSQFTNQKNKVTATQKIPESTLLPHKPVPESYTNIDLRYARLPKELLSQDLGSIVKNVHGIFSSVSGSLKNAYIHQRAHKPAIKNVVKPVSNGKVMNDIFEDESSSIITVEKPLEIPIVDEAIKLSEVQVSEQESNAKKDVLKLQVEMLERLLSEQRKENTCLREQVKQLVDEVQEKDHTSKEVEAKLDLMSKRVEQAEREKDAAVMRYASVECTAIEARRAAEKASAAEKAALVETELLANKLKSAHAEKQRICQLYDDKCHELSNSERELAKIREDMRELEGRLKWTQSKLRCEMDAYKESAERAEKLSQQVTELEAAKEAATTNATDALRARQLEQELKESQASLILCRHEREELEKRLTTTTQQLDVCRKERDSASSALSRATAEVEQLKESNLRLEEEAAELAALRAQAALADTLGAQLQRETERATSLEESLRLERARAETCARREAAALEHAATLTAQHVAARATSSDTHAKAQALALDNASLRERITELEQECTSLRAALNEETERRNKENRVLARKVAELTEEAADAKKKLEWETGENDVLKKKHASAIKELNRELQRALKRCEQLEAKLPPPDTTSTRTGSISSLSSGESAPQEEGLPNGHTASLPDVQVREPDRQALIERIVSLQRAAARRSERCEFLEEHSRQLTAELRAKSRLLRHLLCSMPAGAVASQDSDAHKPKRRLTKREIARLGGGAMAAVWGGDPNGMTLELSLEMNKRLQAVLEDALLKNITLKENMDTLGEEIARLKERKATETKSS